MGTPQLSQLVNMDDPPSVLGEVTHILTCCSPTVDTALVQSAGRDIQNLFTGRMPGYRACNTEYHDLKHTTDTAIALARLIHGAVLCDQALPDHAVEIALLAALCHDAGYIQTEDDTEGTGAKYTAHHIDRSIEFVRDYFAGRGLSQADVLAASNMLHCTGLSVDITALQFADPSIAILGKMLGAADLLGQMADRYYLEKLPFLYHEFVEGNIPGFRDEFDLLEKTLGFCRLMRERMATSLSGVDAYMRHHFRARWDIDTDLYARAIDSHMAYLKIVVEEHSDDFLSQLRRGDWAEKFRRTHGDPSQRRP